MNTEIALITSISANDKGKIKYNGNSCSSAVVLDLGKRYKLHIVRATLKIVAVELVDGDHTENLTVIRIDICGKDKYAIVSAAPENAGTTHFKVEAATLTRPGKYTITYKWDERVEPTITTAIKL